MKYDRRNIQEAYMKETITTFNRRNDTKNTITIVFLYVRCHFQKEVITNKYIISQKHLNIY